MKTKDTIFPVKFHKSLSFREIELFQSICSEFAKNIQTELSFISFSAVANRLKKQTEETKSKCLEWIHKLRIDQDDKYCPICGERLQ